MNKDALSQCNFGSEFALLAIPDQSKVQYSQQSAIFVAYLVLSKILQAGLVDVLCISLGYINNQKVYFE